MSRRTGLRLWGMLLAGALGLGVFGAVVSYAGLHLAGRDVPFLHTTSGTIDWVLWALLTPGIVWLARRFRIERGRVVRGVALHLVLGVVVALGELAGFTLAGELWQRALGITVELTRAQSFFLIVARWLPPAMVVYWTIVAATHAVDHYRHARERDRTVSELRLQLAQAELHALKMQLHPHFLYNTLNTIAALVRDGKRREAVEMVAGLGDLLRAALENAGEQLVPLREEVGLAQRYLEIERIRHGDRLDVRYGVAPESLDALVPNLLLQPLVENAVRHGLSQRPESHRIEIRSARTDGRLRLEVVDDGPGFDRDPLLEEGEGVGIRTTLERLRHLYGSDFRFRAGDAPGGGARIEVEIPWREESGGAEES